MSDEKDWKKGDKRSTAIEIMKDFMVKYPDGHSFEECTRAIREALFGHFDDPELLAKAENQARSYYMHIVNNKMIDGFVMGAKSKRKTRSKSTSIEVEPATTEKRGTPERLALMKKVASQRKNKKTIPTPEEATKEIEALAAAGAQYQYAETEETSKSLEPA
jgi:hypothetical protein